MSYATIIGGILGQLEQQIPGYTWDHGWRDQPPDRRNAGYVYGVSKAEDQENVLEEFTEVGIRMFPNFDQARGKPRDSSVFEDAAEQLQGALRDKQTEIPQAAGFWFMRVTEITIDHELQKVDATVRVFGQSPFAVESVS